MQCTISKSNVKFTGDVAWMIESLLQHNAFALIFFKTMYNLKQLLDLVFVTSGISKCYQPQPLALAENTYLDLDYSEYNKNLIQ